MRLGTSLCIVQDKFVDAGKDFVVLMVKERHSEWSEYTLYRSASQDPELDPSPCA